MGRVKFILLEGVPASGKTTILRSIREKYFKECSEFKYKSVKGLVTPDNSLYIVGVFDGSTYEGTDKLDRSHAADDLIEYISTLTDDCVILGEGYPLFCHKFVSKEYVEFYIVHADDSVLHDRHIARGDRQTSSFLSGLMSRVRNFSSKYTHTLLYNNTPDDLDRAVGFLSDRVGELLNNKCK